MKFSIKMLIAALLVFLILFVFYVWASSGNLWHEALSQILVYSTNSGKQGALSDTFTVMTYNVGYLSGMKNNLAVRGSRRFYHRNLLKD
ncbi:hypothetical protein GWN42_03325 [candidate division KSB1 bacterium]|nr:hypothetical protein [candidate division KSB1 bacterium]